MESLVKYENPVLVSKNTDRKGKVNGLSSGDEKDVSIGDYLYIRSCLQSKQMKNNQQGNIAAFGSGGPIPSPPKNKLPALDVQKNQQTEEILNSILPPR